MSEDIRAEGKISLDDYVNFERVLSEYVDRGHEILKRQYEYKYKSRYQMGKLLSELWKRVKWRSKKQMFQEYHFRLSVEYKDEYTPSTLKKCYYFYEFVERWEELRKKLLKLHFLYKVKREEKEFHHGTLITTWCDSNELKNIEEEYRKLLEYFLENYPRLLLSEEYLIEQLDRLHEVLKNPLIDVLGYRVLWEIFTAKRKGITDEKFLDVISVARGYKDRKSLEGLRRALKDLGGKSWRGGLPYCGLCGATRRWEEKYKMIPILVDPKCYHDYLVGALNDQSTVIIEDRDKLEEVLKNLKKEEDIEEI